MKCLEHGVNHSWTGECGLWRPNVPLVLYIIERAVTTCEICQGDGGHPGTRSEMSVAIHTIEELSPHRFDNAFMDETHGSEVGTGFCEVPAVLIVDRNIRAMGPVGSPAKIFGIGYSDRQIINGWDTQIKVNVNTMEVSRGGCVVTAHG